MRRLLAWPCVLDVVVTEQEVCVYFDAAAPPERLESALAGDERGEDAPSRVVTIRARYDGEDLPEIAARLGLLQEAVVALHTGRLYSVEMVGFLPGFAYLSGLDERLVIPRRATPRARIAPRSIGIAAGYTGVYPLASPGGWNLLGTAIDFEPFTAEHGASLGVGDSVRFEQVA